MTRTFFPFRAASSAVTMAEVPAFWVEAKSAVRMSVRKFRAVATIPALSRSAKGRVVDAR
ncbi:MAG: hypothetical protein ACE5I2_16800 [Anaerolineae bacterium]